MLQRTYRKLPASLQIIIESIINSYTIVFFSKNKIFGIILIAVSFISPVLGISGLISIIVTNLIAYWLGFNRQYTRDGLFGFNSLLVGLGIGAVYQFGFVYLIVLVFASLLTFIITIGLSGVLGKYDLPFLTLPFIFAIWVITLASRQFSHIELNQQYISWINQLNCWLTEQCTIPDILQIYFKSLGAILCQHNVIAGILIAIGLLIYSRIAFTLSLIELIIAYGFYRIIGADINDFQYHHTGFNFILTAIAIGGFFVIPSTYSYLFVIILIPIITVLIISFNTLLGIWTLPIYSLPFSLVVISFLYALKLRYEPKVLQLALMQYFSPEENLYKHINISERFKNKFYFQLQLPFWGDWMVLQGHNSNADHATHKNEWSKALDFTILDAEMKPYKDDGGKPEDYYCYDKPLLAPADGFVEEAIDYIDDNHIGGVNLQQNWGNTVVIRHLPGLYTQLNHLKKNSLKIKKGDFVKKGDIIAHCGNSGRSPVPHLHFQVQATPYIGSKTIAHPIAYYIGRNNDNLRLKLYDTPKEGELVSNININDLLKNAFTFIPGRKFRFEYTGFNGAKQTAQWEILTDIYNQSYIYCNDTRSYAYFVNDGAMFYFTRFDGDRTSLLFYFYLALYRIILGFYPDIELKDSYPVDHLVSNKLARVAQDFIAPFHMFLRSEFSVKYVYLDSEYHPNNIKLQSRMQVMLAGKVHKRFDFGIEIENNNISILNITLEDKKLQAHLNTDASSPR